MRTQAEGCAAVWRGVSRGFGVLLLGGLIQPLVAMGWEPLAYVWLLLVAIGAFLVAAVAATPTDTPVDSWRQGPFAAVGAYAMTVPLVIIGAGELPVLQAVLTTASAVVVGSVVALARTHYDASRRTSGPALARPVTDG
ncbi:hypothetical protein BH11ACT8_BH11ACT8_35380 [soil metagenome]